ncbi:hypothetical protein RJ639_044632 [Escallonia herrerae]|uniref:Calcineurin-like phosphoesterase domain-containing protein n=1 Tax=Escallonia herrerae TaxID=1293975 RepID=A0AA88W9N9_9ASTE|nr:hypothetical protein RJ639_044632 [Escallonia herrerae]
MLESQRTWIHSTISLTLIAAFLYLQLLVSHKLILGHHQHVTIKKQPDLPLRFRSDGTFKILQVSAKEAQKQQEKEREKLSGEENGDYIDVLNMGFVSRKENAGNVHEAGDISLEAGDNIFGPSTSDAAESLFQVFGPAMESRLPWAAVLGNHDQESTMTREELMSFISLMDYSVSQRNPSAEVSDPSNEHLLADIDGFGNYNLNVWGAPGSHLANNSVLNLYFLDSGDRAIVDGVRTYGWIKESQLSWLRGISEVYQGQNQGKDQSADISFLSPTPPALAFFHIPIPEIRQLSPKEIVGHFQEYAACSSVNSGVLQTLVSMGDVKAVFIGHDHTNDFCGKLSGIWFCYGGGFGYHGYGKAGLPRRARVIKVELGKGEKAWMGVQMIKTWKRLDDEKLSKIDEQVLWEQQS